VPAVETCLPSPTSTGGRAFAAEPQKSGGTGNSGADFDSVIQSKLARDGSKPAAKDIIEPEPEPVCDGTSLLAQLLSALTNPNESTGNKSDVAAVGDKKEVADITTKAADTFNLAAAPDGTVIPPAALPLLPLPAPVTPPAPEKSAAGFVIEAVGDSGTPREVADHAPANRIPPAGTPPLPATASGKKEENGWLQILAPQKEISPATAAQTKNAAVQQLAPVADSAEKIAAPDSPMPAATSGESSAASHPDKRVSRLDAAGAAEASVKNGGTGVALDDSPMKNPQKTNKVAGPDAKVLPVLPNPEPREKNLPAGLQSAVARVADINPDSPFSFSNGANQSPSEKIPTLNVIDLPSLTDLRMRAVERTHDMVALHSMRLVESKSDSLSVIIKPAIGMELSLELRQRGDGVSAQATVTSGDHQFLNQHWPELQQRLEQRGIKLAALETGADFSAGGQGDFQRQQPSVEDLAQQAAAFAEFAAAGPFGGASARLAAHDGWESWA
jgi:hypothetical protein